MEEFELGLLTSVPGGLTRWEGGKPRAVLALDGEVILSGAGHTVRLARGQSLFVPAAEAGIEISGTGTLVTATTGPPTR